MLKARLRRLVDMSEVDDVRLSAREAIMRSRQRLAPPPKRASAIERVKRATKYALAGVGTILVASFIWGLVTPIGVTGVMIEIGRASCRERV